MVTITCNKDELLYVIDKVLRHKIEPEFNYCKDSETGCECFVYSTPSYVYIGFYGTNELIDWKTNMWFVPKQESDNPTYEKMRIHSGYFEGYLNLRNRLFDIVINKVPNIRNICILGYSMGGGLAPLCALDLYKCYYFFDVSISCILIGSPKIFDCKSAKKYNMIVPNTVRIIYDNDIVPMLPFIGFKHVGALFHYNKDPLHIFPSVKTHDSKNYRKACIDFVTNI